MRARLIVLVLVHRCMRARVCVRGRVHVCVCVYRDREREMSKGDGQERVYVHNLDILRLQ